LNKSCLCKGAIFAQAYKQKMILLDPFDLLFTKTEPATIGLLNKQKMVIKQPANNPF